MTAGVGNRARSWFCRWLGTGLALWSIGCNTEPSVDEAAAAERANRLLGRLHAVFGGTGEIGDHHPASLADRDSQMRERAAQAPRGPQPITVYLRRNETLANVASWAGKAKAELAADNELDLGREHSVGTPVHLVLDAEELDAFEKAREAHHQAYKASFTEKYEVASTRRYTVKRGDSAWKLVRMDKHVVPLWLMEDNNAGIDMEHLQVGDMLTIPVLAERKSPAGVQPASEAPRAPDLGAEAEVPAFEGEDFEGEDLVIRVQQGESLSHYARWSGLTAVDIAKHNGLADPNRLELGQSLRLPVPEDRVAEFYRRRTQGRHPAAAAPSQRRPLPAAMAAPVNDSSSVLDSLGRSQANPPQSEGMPVDAEAVVREVLAIKAPPAPPAAPAAPAAPEHIPSARYTVQLGDSAWTIAVRRFAISLAELQRLNPGLELDRLQPGDEVRVPAR